MHIYTIIFFLLTLVSLASLPACTRQSGETMTVLAGSELEDLTPMLEQIQAQTGVRLEMRYTGTLDGAERLIGGEAVDLAWFSHGKYLSLLQGASKRLVAQEKIMLSPVVLGVKENQARAWGWIDNPNITWKDIATKAGAGELRYGMANPPSSNSGFTALVGVVAALSDNSEEFHVGPENQARIQAFFRGQRLTAGSSGWLAERYVQEQAQLNGLINYESVLLQLNASGTLTEKLFLVYPREGIITADYPLMLFNEAKRAEYERVVTYLRSPEFQRLLVERTQRRSVLPTLALPAHVSTQPLIELPFPRDLETIDRLLFAYLDEQRIPSHPFFVLDVSGSMKGKRLANLKAAMNSLTGQDHSLTGQFARFRGRERITILTFNDQVEGTPQFAMEVAAEREPGMVSIRDFIDGLQANGGTAIFSAVHRAYTLIGQAHAQDPSRYYSVVLLSDGENTQGESMEQFLRYHATLPEEIKRIKTFTILFGDAKKDEVDQIAAVTGGRTFDSREKSLSEIFKTIRGYQ